MNLYLFNANDIASTYGIGTYIKELTCALEDAELKLHIVYLHSNRIKFEIIRTKQVTYWHIPEVLNENTFSGSVQKLEDYYSNVIYLLRINIKDTTDLVFHFNFNQSQLLAKELKAVFNCRTVTTIHYTKWGIELQGNLNKLHALKVKTDNQRNEFEQLLMNTDEYESLLFKEVDYVIALSQEMKQLLNIEYLLDSNKIAVIPNGLGNFNDVHAKNRNNLRTKWHISKKETIILFVGRLHAMKGLVFLLKSFRNVLNVIPYSRLVIAGNGNYDTYLQGFKDICAKITFTGLLEKQELYELYQIADVGVVPSLYEPFGYVAVEMMMHKLPIVATATSGLNEVVDDTCGLKIPIIEHPDSVEIDTDLLAEKILYILQHPKEARQMGQNGRKRYLKKYTSEIFRQNMLNFYNSLWHKD